MRSDPIVRTLLAGSLAAILLLITDSTWYWATVASFAVFGFSGSIRQLRPDLGDVLTPRGSLYWVGAAVLVFVPALVLVFEPFLGQLSSLPDTRYFNLATLLSTCFYAAYLLGFHWAVRRNSSMGPKGPDLQRYTIPSGLLIAFAAIGILGILGRLAPLGGPSAYFRGLGTRASEQLLQGDSALALFGVLGPPFLTASALGVWRNIEVSRRASFFRRFALAIVAVAPMTVYGYNRAATFTTLAALATMSASLRPIRKTFLIAGGFGVLLMGYWFGSFRTEVILGRQVSERSTLQEFLQVYVTGPQFVGFGVSQGNPADGLNTVIASLLSPIPIIGEDFRSRTGTRIYNYLLYGGDFSSDQILPAPVELLWAGGLGLVVATGILLGYAIGKLQSLFESTGDPLTLFYASFISMWVAAQMFMSLQVLAQIMFYFVSAGVLLLVAARLAGSHRPTRFDPYSAHV